MTASDIGQLFFCGWQGSSPEENTSYSAHARVLVEEIGVGGIVLMGRNLPGDPPDPVRVAALVNDLQSAARIPLFIGTDQEGGRVARFTNPGLTFPGNMALGSAYRQGADASLSEEVARAIGEQLAAMGVNVNFAPCLDINNNPENPIIGTRSYGETPQVVATLGEAAVRGFGLADVMPVLKHFPGHGDTGVDSHLDLPVQPAPRERLNAVELAPFRSVSQRLAPAVMTSHILFPALDPELPATLSRSILTGLLREEWGYDGLIITDCLEMQAIADRWGPEETAVLALEAGADMLLVCHTLDTQRRMIAGVRAALEDGRLSHERITESLNRISVRKEQADLGSRRRHEPARAAEVVGAERYRQLEMELASWGIRVDDQAGLLPLPANKSVAIVGSVSSRLVPLLHSAGVRGAFEAQSLPAREAAAILLLDDISAPKPNPQVGRTSIVVALKEPYILDHYPMAGCRVATFSDRDCSLKALAERLARIPTLGP